MAKLKKQEAKPVYELKYDDEVVKYFISSNPKRTQLILCLVSNRPMSNEDALMALDVFVGDASEQGINVIDDPEFIGNDH